MTSFRHNWLVGTSRRSDAVSDVVAGDYDMLIMTSSWDSRCQCLAESAVTARTGLGIFFENEGEQGLRARHDPVVRDFLGRQCETHSEVFGASEDLDRLWSDIWQAILEAVAAAGRPMRLLFDLSTCPRYYAMAVVANGFRHQLVSELTAFYAEGHYPDGSSVNPHETFTTGKWDTVPVPGLEGASNPSRERRYVVSVGFEGTKTFRAVNAEGADQVSLVLASPGVAPDYEQRTLESNAELIDEFLIPENEFVRAPAADAIATWAALRERSADWASDDVFYLPCGTKAHALGMALHALSSDEPTVMYARPASHRETNIKPLGAYWTYLITDPTSLVPSRIVQSTA